MPYPLRGEDESISLQRLPGQERISTPWPDNFAYVVLMEDPLIHTDDHPFCPDWSCTCHEEDQESIARVNSWVQAGLMTPQEATEYILGRTF